MLKRLFNSRCRQFLGVVMGFSFGIYNLYVMGRTDQIQETMGQAFADPTAIAPLVRTYKVYGGKTKVVEIYPLWDSSDID